MRVIATLQAGPALNTVIADKVMGWKKTTRPADHVERCFNVWGQPVIYVEYRTAHMSDYTEEVVFEPSTNINHAFEVLKHMREYQNPDHPALWWNITAGAFVCIPGFDMTLNRIMYERPDDMPLAICRAAMMAVTGAQE